MPSLEREDVPVLTGVSINESCQTQQLKIYVNEGGEENSPTWMFEFPFFVGKDERHASFRYYENNSLDSLLPVLYQKRMTYGLVFNLKNQLNKSTRYVNIGNYFTDVTSILLRVATYPPKYLVFTGEFLNKEVQENALSSFVKQIREEMPSFGGKIVYAGTLDRLSKDYFDWESPDVIGVSYLPPEEAEYKPHFRTQNQALSKLLLEHQKPAMIIHANLLGANRLLLLKNQLRFWDEKVELEGLVLNTLHCTPILKDSLSRFGLAQDRRLKNWIEAYSQ